MVFYRAADSAALYQAAEKSSFDSIAEWARAARKTRQTLYSVLNGRPCHEATAAAIYSALKSADAELAPFSVLFEPTKRGTRGSLRKCRR